jgi:hypothetical protein
MQFSNPFDNPQGQFYILRNGSSSTACGRTTARCRKAGRWSARRSR